MQRSMVKNERQNSLLPPTTKPFVFIPWTVLMGGFATVAA
jgi:hypothetical protein